MPKSSRPPGQEVRWRPASAGSTGCAKTAPSRCRSRTCRRAPPSRSFRVPGPAEACEWCDEKGVGTERLRRDVDCDEVPEAGPLSTSWPPSFDCAPSQESETACSPFRPNLVPSAIRHRSGLTQALGKPPRLEPYQLRSMGVVVHSFRNRTCWTAWSGPFFKIRCARSRVGRMFSSRFGSLISRQMRVATASASSLLRSA